ncbi:MAG: TAXI family TRAP transporter solute-binding subunit [Pseudomonadota bacterium]
MTSGPASDEGRLQIRTIAPAEPVRRTGAGTVGHAGSLLLYMPRAALRFLLLGLGLLVAMQNTVIAQTSERQIFDLGTATPDGVSHPLGVTIAALIKLKLLPQTNIDINARNTSGSRDNTLALRDATLDFAILSGLDAFDAVGGSGPFEEQGPDADLRHVTNLWTSAYHFIIRDQDVETGTFDDFLSLEGRPIAVGEDDSSLQSEARGLFSAFDVDLDQTYDLVSLGGLEAAEAFLAGDLDGFLLVDEHQGADIAAFLDRAGDGIKALTLDERHIETVVNDGAPAWTPVIVPPGSFTGQAQEHTTIGMPYMLGTSERVPEEVVYRITKTIFDNLLFLKEMHPSTADISLETALAQLLVPVHAGAGAYYGEVGVSIPDPAPVRVSNLSQAPFLARFSSAQEARARLGDDIITVLGGQSGQTSTRMISELAASLNDTGIRVVGMTSPAPAENIAHVLYARGVDSALVPLDILTYAFEQDVYPDLQAKIAYATEMFTEEVHLLTSDDVQELDDLIDRPVNLGLAGSPAAFTSSLILDRLRLPVEPTYFDDRTALAQLLSGDIAALFMISAKPMPLLSEMPPDSGLRLLPLPPIDDDAYRAGALTAVDYPHLLAPGDSIDTFGVRNLLISYNWRSDNPRYRVLSAFIDSFFDRLPVLQQSVGYHPKWQDVDPLRDVEGWRRSPAASVWIEERRRPASNQGSGSSG